MNTDWLNKFSLLRSDGPRADQLRQSTATVDLKEKAFDYKPELYSAEPKQQQPKQQPKRAAAQSAQSAAQPEAKKRRKRGKRGGKRGGGGGRQNP